MKQFFKFFTASCLGTFGAFGILFFFIVALGSSSGGKPTIEKNSILKIELSSFIPEITGNVQSSGLDFQNTGNLGLNTITQLLAHAAADDKIKGILLNTTSVGGGQATIATIREQLLQFKKGGKFIYAYSDYYSQSAYYLASVADSIFLNPVGMADVKGFATLIPFYKEGLDRLGISMNIFYAGNFKSATEPYRRNEMSDENRLQIREFLESMVTHFRESVAASRQLTVDQVDQIMTEYKGRNGQSSLEAGLVDKLVYMDEVASVIRKSLDLEDSEEINYVTLKNYNQAVNLRYGKSKSKDKIAVLYAEGTIKYKSKDKGAISEDQYLKILAELENDEDVKAVVLRVNSPGGNSLTSEIIWRGIEKLKAKGKPVIASFGDYAASGGYYIAAGADSIVSAPNTLTGSIGVFTMFPNAKELLSDKLGITFDEVKTHPMAVGLSTVKDLSDLEKEILQKGTIETYDLFLKRVAEGRKMTIEKVHEIAQGRVWTGTRAKELGLVDVIGGLDDAIKMAGNAAGIEEYKIKSFPKIEESLLEQFIKGMAMNDDISARLELDPTEIKLMSEIKDLKSLISDQNPQVRLPYIFQFD